MPENELSCHARYNIDRPWLKKSKKKNRITGCERGSLKLFLILVTREYLIL
uniref:Uncharacterized protein n=1 Tax=Picea sitchensis TaxID=3332 RepID=A9NXL6_PICSI|nr:unknown [Picea sitchensis]ABK25488.1 unknown [Picea sitchensis]